jgi:hypothetical protein
MRSALLGLALSALAVTAVHAADQFAGLYGNTVNVTEPNGSKSIVYVNADKTWERRMADGKVLRGTFEWKDETHVCFTLTDPKPEKPEPCDPYEINGDHKPGDTWVETDDKGNQTTISVTAGRS